MVYKYNEGMSVKFKSEKWKLSKYVEKIDLLPTFFDLWVLLPILIDVINIY